MWKTETYTKLTRDSIEAESWIVVNNTEDDKEFFCILEEEAAWLQDVLNKAEADKNPT